jgi:2-deoxy-D-gluconate 3-dehydrogenase
VPDPLFDLSGRVALVTGGNGGLGRAVALGFRDRGARAVVTGRDPGKNAAVAAELGDAGIAVPLDLHDEAAVEAVVAATVERFGRIDILVNNAGDVWGNRLPGFPTEDWDALVGAHLRGSFLCAKHASAAMIAAGEGGKIINVSSVFGLFGPPGLAHYASAKAGVLGLTRALAVELAPHHIQANCLVPGFFETELALRNTTPERRDEVRRRTPAGRWGRPEEIVGAAVLLASRASDFITGTSLVVDGGYVVSERLLHD